MSSFCLHSPHFFSIRSEMDNLFLSQRKIVTIQVPFSQCRPLGGQVILFGQDRPSGKAGRCITRGFPQLRNLRSIRFSPHLEKASAFLDDSLLPATSNAVERGNRRHRKMQKGVCRVGAQDHIKSANCHRHATRQIHASSISDNGYTTCDQRAGQGKNSMRMFPATLIQSLSSTFAILS